MTSQPIELRTPIDLGLVAEESTSCGCGCSYGAQDEADTALLEPRA
ncbi:MAG: hypothetical protein ABI053_04825 [Lacisediminihabitans sp.]